MEVKIDNTWRTALSRQWEEPYFKNLTDFVRERYRNPAITVYPPARKIFAAFDQCPFNMVKVVIIGQDPYHGPNQANGLCFSVNSGVPLPPSLLNIFKEIKDDIGLPEVPTDGDLSRWAKQGVLLLNATLTVDAHFPASHQGKGWERFTDEVIMRLNSERNNIVFILWGSYAIKKGAFIDRQRHLVLTSAHPSPLSAYRGFFGSKPFSRTNQYLIDHNISPINWE
ncbi:uracil-DNA glycosylase [Muribaculum caecicola]|uniref:Uracil-DNA glycosylase n=1 Tax=Muribaculum caecicola TaxID=3038144 RepID=A0AC61S4K6_9BACT|nr:uracil-DNA glycosylase [Muribaculum caecicola]THG46406.1 uracil-DNA glycosylase [Muribaculum caecicola]